MVDLAEGHLAALDHLDAIDGAVPVNLGTGTGSSVLDVVRAAVGGGRARPSRTRSVRAAPGDVVAVWADPARAASLLSWRASRTLADMCADHWRWQSDNPDGYRG